MRKVTCDQCGRTRPRSKMHMSTFRMRAVAVDGSITAIRETQVSMCGTLTCTAAIERQKAQVRKKMLGDVHLWRLLYVTEVRL